jgi:hypothetical protein
MFLILISFIVTGVGQAATIFAVSDIYLGKMATIRNSFQQIRGHILQALGTIFIVALAVGAGFICLVIPGIVIGCRTSVAIPAAMLEDLGAGAAFSRSMELVDSPHKPFSSFCCAFRSRPAFPHFSRCHL